MGKNRSQQYYQLKTGLTLEFMKSKNRESVYSALDTCDLELLEANKLRMEMIELMGKLDKEDIVYSSKWVDVLFGLLLIFGGVVVWILGDSNAVGIAEVLMVILFGFGARALLAGVAKLSDSFDEFEEPKRKRKSKFERF